MNKLEEPSDFFLIEEPTRSIGWSTKKYTPSSDSLGIHASSSANISNGRSKYLTCTLLPDSHQPKIQMV